MIVARRSNAMTIVTRWIAVAVIIVVTGSGCIWSASDNDSIDHQLNRIHAQFDAVDPVAQTTPNLRPRAATSRPIVVDRLAYDFVLVRTFGSYGAIRDRFNTPAGIACDSQYVYIVDKHNNRIVKLDHNFGSWDQIQMTSETDLGLDYPDNAVLIGSTILISDTGNNRLVQCRSTGEFVGKFGELGILPGNFDSPRGMAQNSRNELLVCDASNNRIQAFDSRGNVLYEWGRVGMDNDVVGGPVDMVVLADDSVAVVDSASHSIKVFSRDGMWIRTLFAPSATDATAVTLAGPSGIGLDDAGVLYVADTAGNKVVAVTVTGKIVGVLSIQSPMDVTCWGDFVFVTSGTTHSVSKYRRTVL